MINIHKVSPNLKVTIKGKISPPTEILPRIDEVWQKALEQNDLLFDGGILAITNIISDSSGHVTHIETAEAKYRYFYTQRQDKEIAAKFGVYNLGVNGIIICKDGIFMGKRSEKLGIYPGFWEPVTAGGVDLHAVKGNMVDIIGHTYRELEEETGLKKDDLYSPPLPYLLEKDEAVRVVSIAVKIHSRLSRDEILKSFDKIPNKEYSEVAILDKKGLKNFFRTQKNIMPFTVRMIEYL